METDRATKEAQDRANLEEIHSQQLERLHADQENEKRKLLVDQNGLMYQKPKLSQKEIKFHAILFTFASSLDSLLLYLAQQLHKKLVLKKIYGARLIKIFFPGNLFVTLKEFLLSKGFLETNDNNLISSTLEPIKNLLHERRIGFNCLKNPANSIENKNVALIYVSKTFPVKIKLDSQNQLMTFSFYFQSYDQMGVPLTDFVEEDDNEEGKKKKKRKC